MNDDIIDTFNKVAWIGANIMVAYIAIVLVIFVIAYYILFDPSHTTAGKFVFRFFVSLLGVIGLVFIGIYIDPSKGTNWYAFPEDILWWRPLLRFIAYAYVAYSITALAILLGIRKWKPELIRVRPDNELIKVRNLHKPE